MIYKILIVISLLKVCAGDGPSHPVPQSNQAISSQSFVRHDVPLSYKYNWVHVYTTTPKPDQYIHKAVDSQQHLARQQLPQIQYAPIYTDQVVQHPNNLQTAPENTNLEPKPTEHTPHGGQGLLSYVPGYNIEVLQSVNRFPGHNAVYRSYPNMPANEKLNKVNFLNQYVLQDKQYIATTQSPQPHDITTIAPQKLAPPKVEITHLVPQQHFVQQPVQNVQNIPVVGYLPNRIPASMPQPILGLQDFLPHPKDHRMLLNVAHAFNIAQDIAKAQHSGHKTKGMPFHTRAFIRIRQPSAEDENSLLSIQNRQLYSPVNRLP